MGAIAYRQIGSDELAKFFSLLVDFCIETNADDDALALILQRIEDGRTVTFAAENGSVCGVLGYIQTGDRAIPDFFFVKPEYRQGIIGGKLMKVASKHAKMYGVKKIIPMVTEDKESLYTKLGFKRKYIMLEKEI